MTKAFPFHPFLFALSPIVFLLSRNSQMVPLAQTVGPAVALVLFAALILLLAYAVLRDIRKAALFTSLFVLVFFSHRDLFIWLERLHLVTRARYLVAAYALLFPALLFLLWRSKRSFHALTAIVNVTALVLVCFNVVGIAIKRSEIRKADVAAHDISGFNAAAPKPDIFYFILDGYARGDVMRDVHGHDNEPFLNELRKRGFFTADSSRSNYGHTIASLASTLNFQYLRNKPAEEWRMRQMIQDNKAFSALRQLGYAIYTFPTGFEWAEIVNVDHHRSSAYMNDLSMHLINKTPIVLLPLHRFLYIPLKRNLLLYPYSQLNTILREPSPKLVYVHSICPHPPFIFGPNGEPTDAHDGEWKDNEWKNVTKDGYAKQTMFINKTILAAVDSIIEKSKIPPVVVIHSDHGSLMTSSLYTVEGNDMGEHFSNLCAIRLPGADAAALPKNMTPVNIFPTLFNHLFDAKMTPLPDTCFFYTWAKDAAFIDVTERVKQGETERRKRVSALPVKGRTPDETQANAMKAHSGDAQR